MTPVSPTSDCNPQPTDQNYPGRYQVMRLVKTEVSLLPNEGFELPSRSDDPNAQGFDKETAYAIPFDLKIPGWLPQSFENDTVALSYGLVATVKLGWSAHVIQPHSLREIACPMDVDTVSTSSSPVPIMSAASQSYSSRFFPRLAKSVASALATAITLPSSTSQQVTRTSEWQPITVMRHRVPAPPCSTSLFSTESVAEPSLRHYTLRPAENSPSPVECVVSVPETIDINGPTLRVSVRLRARNGFNITGLEEAEGQSPLHASSEARQGEQGAEQGTSPSAAPAYAATSPLAPVTTSATAQKELEHIRMVELGMEVEETERYSWVHVVSLCRVTKRDL